MKANLRTILTTALVPVLILVGCGSPAVNTPANEETVEETIVPRPDDGRTVVGISMPDKLLERWNRDGAFLEDQFKGAGCEVILKFANNLIDTQTDDLKDMIAEGADLLVISAVDGSAISSVLEDAHRQGIKVIAYDRLIMNTNAVDYYVSFDNYKVGELQADYIIASLGLEGSDEPRNIEFVTGDPVDNNARFFTEVPWTPLSPTLMQTN